MNNIKRLTLCDRCNVYSIPRLHLLREELNHIKVMKKNKVCCLKTVPQHLIGV